MRYLIIISLLFTSLLYSQPNAWKYLNFESGGYVTEIIPVKYPAGQQPPDISQQVLYARTDIGGIYRSIDNGQSWVYASNYVNFGQGYPGITKSETHIQGVAVRHHGPYWYSPQTVVVAWGNEEPDAESKLYQCIWRSNNSGITWEEQPVTIQSPGVWFKGNLLPVKIGGPCIVYDPNNIDFINPPHLNNSHMYMGGFGPTDANGNPTRPYLFKSTTDGRNWYRSGEPLLDNFPGQNGEGIICISIKPGNLQHIWIGTTHGIIFTTNAGTNWQRRSIGSVSEPYVKRILLQKDGSNNITGAMVTWGNWNTTGIGRLLASNNWTYEPLNTQFYDGYTGTPYGLFSTLTFVDDEENMIIAGRYERPLRKTTNFGDNWFGETNNSPYNEVVFRYTTSGHNFPAHQQRGELDPYGYMYDGLSCLTKNPNTGWGSHWYLSGGAGPRKTHIDHGVTNNNFSNSRWQYTVLGQAMTVNYDVAFNTVNINGYPNGRQSLYLPLSDWTMGYSFIDELNFNSSGWLIPEPLSYDRHITRFCDYDTYISNVVRILFNPNNPNESYCLGGSIYNICEENRRAGFYKRTINNNGSINELRRNTDPLLQENNRAIVDAILIPNGNNGRIVALVGLSDNQSPPGYLTGIFYSEDEGSSWTQGSFTLPGVAGRPTQDEYNNSKLPALGNGIDGTIGGLFAGHFTLASAGGGLVYLWLESRDTSPYEGGGIFISTDDGETWGTGNNPDGFDGYWGPGSLKYLGGDQIALAVRDFRTNPNGLYIGTINRQNNGSLSWTALGGFTRAEHLDVKDGKWAVYGKRGSDAFNQIYESSDNGVTWNRIPKDNPLPYFPWVHSLRIRPAPYDNELWISTSGQGVFIYNQFATSCPSAPMIISQNTTINNSMYNVPDMIVQNGAHLTIEGSPQNILNFQMCEGRKIEVQEGSRLTVRYVNFTTDAEALWEGITLNDAAECVFENVTFNFTSRPLSIYNSNYNSENNLHTISNCTFNLADNNTQSISLYCNNTNRLYLYNNTFNMTNVASGYGLLVENYLSSSLVAAVMHILNNTFNGGLYHIFINGVATTVGPCYIQYNRFLNPSPQNISVFCNKVSGRFTHNEFNNSDYQCNLMLYECNMDILGNTFSSGGNYGNNIELAVNTYANIEPLVTESGNYIWYGGVNTFYLYEQGNNIFLNGLNGGSYPATNRGRNCFYLFNPAGSYHISGEISEYFSRTYRTIRNYWNITPPLINLTSNGYTLQVEWEPANNYCEPTLINNYIVEYQITNTGNGHYDTVLITTNPGGASAQPDKIIFQSAKLKRSQRNYHLAIEDLKNLINNYDSSRYLITSLDELFMNYHQSDTISNYNVRHSLFEELKNYLSAKMNQYNTNTDFIDKAYRLYLKCLVNQRYFNEAVYGYENIINNHPDPLSRLTASWDKAAVLIIMNTGGGSRKSDENNDNQKYDNKHPHVIASDIMQQSAESDRINSELNRDESSYLKRYNSRKNKIIESRIYNFITSNKFELFSKIREDIRIINNIKLLEENANSIPKRFSLYQNYPNPFNPVTTIKYDIPKDERVTIIIYDILGREITRLVNTELIKAGSHEIKWDASGLASGIYIYRIEAGQFTESKKMVLIK